MTSNNILKYIPQRAPFVMIDKLVDVNESITITSLAIKKDNLFLEDNYFFESGIIENIAQTIAAGAGYRMRESGGKPKIGVIGSVRKLEIKERPRLGQTLETKVEIISEFDNATVVKGTVYCQNKEIATCQMNVFIVDKPRA